MFHQLAKPIVTVWSVAALMLALLSTAVAAEEATPATDDVRQLAERIDFYIAGKWEQEGVTPAPVADDAEYFRRVNLHVAGVVPSASEVRAFLADESPDKRRRVVEDLLEGPGYVTNFTSHWRRVMMPEVAADFQARFLVPGFESWLRQQLIENKPYDEMVREILTVPLDGNRNNFYMRAGEASPLAFYQAKQIKPENLAAATSRMFLGIRIECAQCHDHPFDSWTREQFWSYAAFFAGIERGDGEGILGRVRELFDRRELAIPDSEMVVQAAYLDGREPQWRYRVGPRKTLADWMTSAENPYFARAAVNRIWGHFFGRGLVDPVDDFGGGNDPSHPELLDELAAEFAAHDFDLKFLVQAITASEAYQLTSRQTHESQEYPELFARMQVQGLTAEQIFLSLGRATGYYEPYQSRNPFAFNTGTPRAEFLETFEDESGSPLDRQTTILQALAMMNGQFIDQATSLGESNTLAAVADYPLFDTAGKIETLYLATLSRSPRPEELERLVAYVDSGGPQKDSKAALGDVFWVLLNSSEFLLNH